MGSVNRAPPKKGGFSRAPPGRALVCHERGTGLGAVNGAPLMGCERLGGVSSMGSPPCPLFRCSGCASQPCSRQGGGAVLWGPPRAQFFGGRISSCPFGIPKPRSRSSIPQIPAVLGDCSSRAPKIPGTPLPAPAPNRGLQGRETARGRKLSPPRIPQPQGHPWNFSP